MPEAPDVKAFRKKVYLIVEQIPPGKVSSYGHIAEMIPAPPGTEPQHYRRIRAQWVGRAMRYAPDNVPWQRVINSQGKISLPAGSRAAAIQRMRLEAEGIEFDRNGRIDLNRYGWNGPPPQWAQAHQLRPARPLAKPQANQLSLFPTDEPNNQ